MVDLRRYKHIVGSRALFWAEIPPDNPFADFGNPRKKRPDYWRTHKIKSEKKGCCRTDNFSSVLQQPSQSSSALYSAVQKSLPDDLAGIGHHHKRRRLHATDIVAQPHGLAPFHGGHDHGLLVMGKSSLGLIDGGAPVQAVDDVIADRLRIVADDVEAFAQIDVLDDPVYHQGFSHQSQAGKQTRGGPEDEEGAYHGKEICQKQGGTDVKAGIFLQHHGDDIRAAAGGSDVKENCGTYGREKDGKKQFQHRL